MATRRTPAPPPPPAQLTVDQMTRGVARLERLITEIGELDASQLQRRNSPEVEALSQRIVDSTESVFGHGSAKAQQYRAAARLDNGPWRTVTHWNEHNYDEGAEARQYVTEGKERSTLLLRQAIKWLQDEIADAGSAVAVTTPTVPAAPEKQSRKVFIVHGHDGEAKQAVARFVEAQSLEAIVLHEKASGGVRTVIEKVEAYGSDVGFAIVLLTPDDEGRAVGGELRLRARQNVILEIGYFMGKLGRSKVCALSTSRDMELPSDLGGIVTETFDTMGHGWKASLGKEMEAAGYEIDWAKAMR